MDWRVKVHSPGLGYTGLLTPLHQTGGVIFPYTPTVQVTYAAQYDATPLTHSNYKVHMYSSSSVEAIQVTGDFTAHDSDEAAYLLAVIHFFKTATKMYYGESSTPPLGTPPPLCYLTGFGKYQFENFTLNLPTDCDYIAVDNVSTGPSSDALPGTSNASSGLLGGITGSINSTVSGATSGLPAGLASIVNKAASSAVGSVTSTVSKVINNTTKTVNSIVNVIKGPVASGLTAGGNAATPSFNSSSPATTMVPTKMQITFQAIPIISRAKVSNEFSIEKYKTGSLLGKGFW
jgi:hypothetical protein